MKPFVKFVCFSVAVFVLLWVSPAVAGSLTIRDTSGLLNTEDIRHLRASANQGSFDLHLLVEDTGSQQELQTSLAAWVDSPKVVSFGLDPKHTRIAARFGSKTGVRETDYRLIENAGNSYFKSKDWVSGIESIIFQAQASVETPITKKAAFTNVSRVSSLSIRESTSSWIGIVLSILMFTTTLCILIAVFYPAKTRYPDGQL